MRRKGPECQFMCTQRDMVCLALICAPKVHCLGFDLTRQQINSLVGTDDYELAHGGQAVVLVAHAPLEVDAAATADDRIRELVAGVPGAHADRALALRLADT